MKKYILFLLLFPFFTYADFFDKKIKGEGEVITSNIQISEFDKVEVEGPFKLIVSSADKESLSIQAQANLIDYIQVEVVNERLTILTEEKLESSEPILINLAYKTLSEFKFSHGKGLEFYDIIELESLEMTLAHLRYVDLEFDVEKLKLKLTHARDVAISGEAINAKISMHHVRNVELDEFAAEELKFKIKHARDVSCLGMAGSANYSFQHIRNVDAGGMRVRSLEAKLSHSKSVTLNSTKKLSLTATHSKKLYLKGKPQIDKLKLKHAGEIIHI